MELVVNWRNASVSVLFNLGFLLALIGCNRDRLSFSLVFIEVVIKK